jgi:alpha-beta hydrolase superfamily lysophospholipase
MLRSLLAALLLATPAAADSFVLVPGAFGGAWTWDAVAARLRAQGHAVTAVELKGQGTRLAENGPEVSVEDHIADVSAAIAAAAPPVILVAHSYGGRPATGAWDRMRDRLAHVIWVEAPAPLTDVGLPADDDSLAFVVTMYPEAADAGMLPPPVVRTGTYDHELTPMSLKALYGPVPLSAPLPDTPGTFVHAEDSSLPGLKALGEALAQRRGWTLVALPGGHDLPTDSPEALADLLLQIAEATE